MGDSVVLGGVGAVCFPTTDLRVSLAPLAPRGKTEPEINREEVGDYYFLLSNGRGCQLTDYLVGAYGPILT